MDIAKISNTFIDNSISATKNAVSDTSFEKSLMDAMEKKDNEALKKVCTEFEGILLQIMYKQMKATVPKASLIPKDSGSEYFESMLDDQLVENASKTNSLGLGDLLYKQLSKQI
ncbi:MAG: flagellar biosynthesis protein FlgJ [Clostridiaceae bacterium]|jgi:flagellar protein FlgJ|nr:flagellar biosynthesis protein FlgJ [Clostridiaceae bacterium]